MAQSALSEKSPEAFRTISEVAEMLDVPQHVLRFWETRFAHIKPLKRAGGRRFYRPEDVALLRGIRVLLYFDGYTIRGAQKVLREKGARFVVQVGRDEMQTNGVEIEALEIAEELDAPDELARETEAESDDDEFVEENVPAHAHDDDAPKRLDDKRRARLEALLEELLALKARLAEARDRNGV